MIRKIRVIPRGYKEILFDVADALKDINRGELFMRLYQLVGKPDDSLSYLLKFDRVVINVSGNEKEDKLWVSPALSQMAEKRRTKTINVMARRANVDGIPFLIDEPFKLYFIVNQKNTTLLEKDRQTKSDEEIKKGFLDYVGEAGREKIHGQISQYLPEVNDILKKFTNEIKQVEL